MKENNDAVESRDSRERFYRNVFPLRRPPPRSAFPVRSSLLPLSRDLPSCPALLEAAALCTNESEDPGSGVQHMNGPPMLLNGWGSAKLNKVRLSHGIFGDLEQELNRR